MNTMKPTAIMQEKIWIKCMRPGYIPQLRMQGPIITPVQVTRQVAHQMIVAGLKVHQIDPKTKIATELNLQNVFPGEGDPVTPAKSETPKPTSGVDSKPIEPVDLKGVTAPIKEENGIKVDHTPVDPKTAAPEPVKAEAEEVKAEDDQKASDVEDQVAGSDETAEAKDAPQDSNKNQNQNYNNNNQKNNKKHK